MPPFVPRKRQHSPSTPAPAPPKKRAVKASKARPNVFETLDSDPQPVRTTEENKAFLQSLQDDEDEESSLSDVDSDEFEDVLPPTKKRKVDVAGEDTDDEVDWEDAIPESGPHHEPSERLDIVLSRPDDIEPAKANGNGKKPGPTKKERITRMRTHCMHVSFLMWHNSIRNSWLNDKDLQGILVNGLSEGMKAEVAKWRTAMGHTENDVAEVNKSPQGRKGKGKAKGKGKGKGKAKVDDPRERIRDWGAEASKLEPGVPNLSRGDPLLRLLKYLSAYWKKRFRVTAPGLRKQGYRTAYGLHEEVKSFKDGPHDPALHGEKIADLEEFKQYAKKCEGSKDVGAQLFTALLRGLGLETRLIASLQPTGFGWSKAEEAKARKNNASQTITVDITETAHSPEATAPDVEDPDSDREGTPKKSKPMPKIASKREAATKRQPRGSSSKPINLDDSDSELSDPPDSDSDIHMSDIAASKTTSLKSEPKPIDKDLKFPIYWTEVLSPVSNTFYPVSTLVNPNVVTAPEHYLAFEPRGIAAEKAKQVICYVTAFSSDRTAKDVTVRYLKRHQLPGKTKGFRLPAEKIPLYNSRGKVIKYEEHDWFQRLMKAYTRSSDKRTIADDLEDQGDLVHFKVEKAAKDGTDAKGVETLQGYKSSAEFVLERHLRREEALLPDAKIVKYFSTGKGDKATTEPVYRRKDVVACKTVESWHKEGREIRTAEQALKFVPFRAVTIIRKREIEDSTRETGEKPTQGLYSRAQTKWIVPPPIQDGKIPRNAFGNIDVYVSSMVPKGAVHVRLKGTAKLCKRLGIDFAEACTGFEFGKQRAVPVLTGVVIAEENEQLLVDAWREEEKIKRAKEDGKREAMALTMWKKFMHGLKIVERMKAEYGAGEELPDGINPFTKKKGQDINEVDDQSDDNGEESNGFVREDGPSDLGGGGFLLPGEDYDENNEGGGGFVLESDEEALPASAASQTFEIDHGNSISSNHLANGARKADHPYPDTPISLQSMHKDPTVTDGVKHGNSKENEDEENEDDKERRSSELSEEEDSEDYAISKTKRGASRRRTGRGRGGRQIGTTRPQRKAATSSPYFKKQR